MDQNAIRVVCASMKGARLAKLQASLKVLEDSAAQGAWIPRGSVKASSGFYQGLYSKVGRDLPFGIYMCLRFGHICKGEDVSSLSPLERAWALLCSEAIALRAELDAARPKPVVTAIGLSPKVTKTFQECNLDLDLPSIKPAAIDFRMIQSRAKDGTLKFYANGEPVMVRFYFVKWSEGVVHDQSRFVEGCQACGKSIPSGRFVPVEADCKRLGKRISLWLGCDCAANIFGIKDIGLAKS